MVPEFPNQFGECLSTYEFSVDLGPLAQGDQMGIGEQSGSQSCLGQDGLDQGGSRTLTLGTGDQHRWEGMMRVVKFVQESGKRIQIEMLGQIGDPAFRIRN